MNKTQALARLDELEQSAANIEAQMRELRQILQANSKVPDHYSHGNLFQSEELARDYAKAINTLLLWRHRLGR